MTHPCSLSRQMAIMKYIRLIIGDVETRERKRGRGAEGR